MSDTVTFRAPVCEDGPAIHALIAACPPLDVNSAYLYHLIGAHFSATSVVAGVDGAIVGVVTGYRPPEQPDILFIWQAAVGEAGRGKGLATRMLDHVVQRNQDCRWIHTTIGPSNDASHALFKRYATQRNSNLERRDFIPADACGPGHEAEDLIIVGPLS
ncbi:MAG: diaminobutyrate acetyltransferase [Planctomycetota bacterium]|nr:MAG: diaminobutyrate acetyltransferase [Planctomycetota bacterium]